MGSFKHKLNNKKQKKQENAAVAELIELKKKMKEQYKAGEYVDAMDTMAEIAQHKKMDPEIMYMGASCYFMTGDYERAAKWVGDALTYDPKNIAARLLLARLCFVEDKPEDGFTILNFVVEKYAGGIRDEENKILLEMLEYCSDNMAELMSQYSPLVEYFHKYYTPPVAPQQNKIETSSIQDMLEASLSGQEPTESPSDTESSDDGKSKAKAAVDRLKALLNKSKGNKADNSISSSQKADSVQQPAEQAPVDTQHEVSESVDDIINQVMESAISFREKIQQLNNHAGRLYIEENYDGALALLKKALEIDAHDPFVLKNIAFTCLALGDKEKAQEYAAAMPMVEFGLLRAIK